MKATSIGTLIGSTFENMVLRSETWCHVLLMSQLMKKLYRNILYKSRLNELSGYSMFWIAVKRIRVLTVYALASLRFFREIRRAKHHAKTVKNTNMDRDVLIIGGGISANSIEINKVLEDQNAHKLDIIAMNWYACSSLATRIIPNYYILTDPIFKPSIESVLKEKSTKDLWKVLSEWKQTELILPNFWENEIDGILNRVKLFIDERELVGFSKNNSPEKPRGYCSLTSSKAIAAAAYLGYRQIYLVGYDSNNFQFRLDENNKLYELARHASDDANSPDLYVGDYFKNGVSELLYSYALVFLDMKRCFRMENISNIQKDSALDAFPKKETKYLAWS